MRRGLIAMLGFVLMLTAQARGVAQEPRMAEPIWSVGDIWTFAIETAVQPRQVVTMMVIGVRDNDYMVRSIKPDGRYEVSSFPRGSTVVSNIGGVGGISWPLSVGQHWSGSNVDRSTNPPTPVKGEAIVDAFELVTIPAGTLGAFRITIRACADVPQGECASARVWIAPQVKNLARMEFGRETVWGELRGATLFLISYAVAP